LRTSSDEGKTWSEPTVCITDQRGYYVLNNNRVIQLPNGRLLAPVALHTSTFNPNASIHELERSFNNFGKIFCYYSDDEGKTWTRSAEVYFPETVIAQEPGVVELANGNILMYIRTDKGFQYYSHSKDRGVTWTPAEPSTIISPLTPATIARLPKSKDLLIVWNNNDEKEPERKGKRTPLTVGISKDNGVTWKKLFDIETNPKGSYCYTGIHYTKKEVLLNYFDWHTRGIFLSNIPLKSIR
jgi:sialidase-1